MAEKKKTAGGKRGRKEEELNSKKFILLFNCSMNLKMFSFRMSELTVLSGQYSEGRAGGVIHRTQYKMKMWPLVQN